jgi:hypothetical protein
MDSGAHSSLPPRVVNCSSDEVAHTLDVSDIPPFIHNREVQDRFWGFLCSNRQIENNAIDKEHYREVVLGRTSPGRGLRELAWTNKGQQFARDAAASSEKDRPEPLLDAIRSMWDEVWDRNGFWIKSILPGWTEFFWS